MHLGDYLREELRVKQSRRRLWSGSQGAFLGFGNQESGIGEKALPTLGTHEAEPAAAVHAWRDKAAETEDRAELKRAGSDG